jgi:hypothetical protein
MSKLKTYITLGALGAIALIALLIFKDSSYLDKVRELLRQKKIDDALSPLRAKLSASAAREAFTEERLSALRKVYERDFRSIDHATPEEIREYYEKLFK